jgi:hypothetical protein
MAESYLIRERGGGGRERERERERRRRVCFALHILKREFQREFDTYYLVHCPLPHIWQVIKVLPLPINDVVSSDRGISNNQAERVQVMHACDHTQRL